MNINIQTINTELTEAIRTYVEEKANSLGKFIEKIEHVDVIIGLENKHHQKGKVYFAEFNIKALNKKISVRKDSEDLYKAIDKVKDHLKVELEKIKGKVSHRDRTVLRDVKSYKE
ncbi:MAG: ribosome-associated translation inhibitor RaiA [Patescibacteria group bacterium]